MVTRSKAFTLIEVLVVVLLCLFLLLVLPPVVRTPRGGAFRMTCGSNLAGISKAMLIYANDYDDEFPRAGSRTSTWGPPVWNALTRQLAYGVDAQGLQGKASVSSSFYLLVKYAEVTPKSFLCTNDTGVSEFTLSRERNNKTITELTQAWDFGSAPATHYSYSYHLPFGPVALTTSGEPGFAVTADRNPWMPAPGLNAKPFPASADGKRRFQGKAGSSGDQLYGNSSTHLEDGQNVLFLDMHVTFEKRAYCSSEDDNIYTISTFPDTGDPLGTAPVYSPNLQPRNRKDSVLVHDPPTWPATAGQR